jgi:hypothetical protein
MPKAAAAKKPALAPNHHHSLVNGLHEDLELLDELVELAAEDADLDDEDAEHTEQVVAAAKEYDAALAHALDDLVVKYPPANGAKADALWDANGPFLVLMTLRGDEPDISDGEWDAFYPADKLDDVKHFLESKLSKCADHSGGGKLGKALEAAALESCGNGGPGDEEDEDEDDVEGDDDEEDVPDSED